MMKTTSISNFLFFLLFISGLSSTHSQNVMQLENEFGKLQWSIQRETIALDSLNSVYQNRLSEIDKLKSSAHPDKDRIAGMMSSTIVIANAIGERQATLRTLDKQSAGLKHRLAGIYTGIIDSLERVKAQSSTKSFQEETDAKLFLYMSKRLQVLPQLQSLSFDPKKMLSVDFSKFADQTKKDLYDDYLRNAIKEIDRLLAEINYSEKELNRIEKMRKKASRFMEDAEFSENLSTRAAAKSSSPVLASGGKYTDATSAGSFNSNFISYSSILQQIAPSKAAAFKDKMKPGWQSAGRAITIKEYQKLIKELEYGLEEYKGLLAKKIQQSK